MRRTAVALVALAALSFTFALTQVPERAAAQGPPRGMGGPGERGPGGPPPGAMMGMPVDSFVADRDSTIRVLLEDLGERKDMPAESVFKNLKILKDMPASRVLNVMNAFSHALGVNCNFCHVPGHWKDEDKKSKQIARDMMKMSSAINDEYLAKMDFGNDHPHVNCTTCHRGEREPMHMMRMMMREQRGPGGPGRGEGPPPGYRH